MSTLGEQFAERCLSAMNADPQAGLWSRETMFRVIAGSYDAFDLMLRQQKARKTNGIPPLVSDVEAYLKEIGYSIDAAAFCDHYEAKGWKISRGLPMKDWKSTVRNWKRNGWGVSLRQPGEGFGNHHPAFRPQASLGALQLQLEAVKREMRNIMNPGGAAWNKTLSQLTPEEHARMISLQAQRDRLTKLIENYGA